VFSRTLLFCVLFCALGLPAFAQDAARGAIRGIVTDPQNARIENSIVTLTNLATGIEQTTISDREGVFWFQMLVPGEYTIRADAPRLHAKIEKLKIDLGSVADVQLQMLFASTTQTVTVTSSAQIVDTVTSEVSSVIDEHAIENLPVNGRRFSDLALQTPGVTQDPRGLTSASTGDLAVGGIRGHQTSFLVDGGDNNNGFFSQARGRYRAPYQFSNEVIQEFRVSSNAYGAELGRAGGGVVNVVTKGGSNQLHGSVFYYLRDKSFNAQHPYLDFKPSERQHQYGFSLGGPIQRNRTFFYAGWDKHMFDVPVVVRFTDGSSVLVPQATDYEARDETLVRNAASDLNKLAGTYHSAQQGGATFLKLDSAISSTNHVVLRFNTSKYGGDNNVFLDPASPITDVALSGNGEEKVLTRTAFFSQTITISPAAISHLTLQFSGETQQSEANSDQIRTKISGIFEGIGRSNILPRNTREHRLHITETVTATGRRHTWKLGGNLSQTWLYNYFPMLFGGQFIFDDVPVNPWTFQPSTYGLWISPLRAYAHGVPRYYIQDFGNAVSRPSTLEYATFMQDSIRVTDRFALNLGLRHDLQSFGKDLEANPIYPAAGQFPHDAFNLAPRVGAAYNFGDKHPVVLRGGYGIFYTRIPSIYISAIETNTGLAHNHLFLDNRDQLQRSLIPPSGSRALDCSINDTFCPAPEPYSGRTTTQISAFAPDFQVPHVTQASFSAEHEVWSRIAISGSYLYTSGKHLIRARDVNLPEPLNVSYPVYDDSGDFTGDYYELPSFATWQMTRSLTCPYPPCLNDVERPYADAEAINVFESASTSVYHGFTIAARRRMTDGFYFRLAYTYATATDNGQDALVVGRSSTVQNSYNTNDEWGPSATDQRQRFVLSWIAEPKIFGRDQPILRFLFNGWKFSGVTTFGSGRPVNARVVGDANGDGNTYNDRLPGTTRNSFTGPDYMTTDFRVNRRIRGRARYQLLLMAESFNVFNRTNARVNITDDGFDSTAGKFVMQDVKIGNQTFPAIYRTNQNFLKPNDAYNPRQIQVSLRLKF